MDVERLTMVYPDVAAITRDLRFIGARNATAARRRGLTGKGRWRAMREAYESQRQAGLLPASYEVVYGAAWGAVGRPAIGPGRRSARARGIGRAGPLLLGIAGVLCPPGRIYCLRGIPFGWSRVVPLAERRPHTSA